ncbi:MAG: CDP-diacylglycerol---glycerol-3-phosphate 3-phosphatidyltransferase [Micromonosporaceae bacterium]|jgi:CDP-diacylglycerol--glycerol-3-phosphate 3-phosphatidyltransferase|nr:CDP-diacylglycerol---glycerol-3-phosphate 3-phosphatidyltransferase [Micromonosporaceae bacterium]
MMTWDSYVAGWRDLHGGYDPFTGSRFVRGWLRLAYVSGRAAARLGATPNTVTGVGLLLSAGVPATATLSRGGPLFAAALVLLSAIADSVDGAVAVIAGTASRAGQVYDAVADRLSEVCWLVALWLLGAPVWLLIVAGGLSGLHEYLRARAAAAGMTGVGVVTVAERPTRIIVVVAGLVVAGVAGLLATGTGPPADPRTVGVTVAAASWAGLALVAVAHLALAVRAALR